MINIILLISGFIITVVCAGISFLDKNKEIRSSGKSNANNKITFTAILIGALVASYSGYNSLYEKEISDIRKQRADSLLLQLQLSVKDSIINEVKKTYFNSIKASNEALAKYNLKITDSLHSVVSNLKLDAVHPQLLFLPLEVGRQSVILKKESEKDILDIKFISKGGTCYHILLDCYIIEEIIVGHQYTILQSQNIGWGERFLTEDVFSTLGVELKSDLLSHSNLIVYVTGTFSKDTQGNMQIPFNDAFRYNFKENKYISGWEAEYGKLKNMLRIESPHR